MYIKKVEISNVRSITYFEMDFEKPAGWHVLIGDNGAGKSSIIRCIALGLVGPHEIAGIKPNWNDWLKWGESEAYVHLNTSEEYSATQQHIPSNLVLPDIRMKWGNAGGNVLAMMTEYPNEKDTGNFFSKDQFNWFSAGFGPFRRFTGGSYEKDLVFENPGYSRLAAHLSLFGEDVALTEATKWLMNLQFKTLEKSISENVLPNFIKLINSKDFLPHNTRLKEISSSGVTFTDGNGSEISVTQMSDGYRSILSLTFELIRLMIKVYGEQRVFENIEHDDFKIDLPGVVLIDEVDVHLHPTWQTRIGQWFTKYFPAIQFIVTSHSPLVCRACENGSIWRLAAPGSDYESKQITGDDRNRLIYGNVLDAYGTEVFGADVTININAVNKKEELVQLSKMKTAGKITYEEESQLEGLRKIFSTDDTLEL